MKLFFVDSARSYSLKIETIFDQSSKINPELLASLYVIFFSSNDVSRCVKRNPDNEVGLLSDKCSKIFSQTSRMNTYQQIPWGQFFSKKSTGHLKFNFDRLLSFLHKNKTNPLKLQKEKKQNFIISNKFLFGP